MDPTEEIVDPPPEPSPIPSEDPPAEPEKEVKAEKEVKLDAHGSKGLINDGGIIEEANAYVNEHFGDKIRDIINVYAGGAGPQTQQDETRPLLELTHKLSTGGSQTCCLEPSIIQEHCDTLKSSRL